MKERDAGALVPGTVQSARLVAPVSLRAKAAGAAAGHVAKSGPIKEEAEDNRESKEALREGRKENNLAKLLTVPVRRWREEGMTQGGTCLEEGAGAWRISRQTRLLSTT